jgi:hypothetical protein
MFKQVYNRLLKSIIYDKPYLCLPASYFRKIIRSMYETGQIKLDSVDDLEKVLNELNTWKMEDYREFKKRYINHANEFKSSIMEKPTLSSLYKSIEIQNVIYQLLSDIFNKRFTKIISEAKAFKPYICNAAECYIEEIKDKFIEEGYILKNYEDLEVILNDLKVWKDPKYNKERNEFIEQYPYEKILRFID